MNKLIVAIIVLTALAAFLTRSPNAPRKVEIIPECEFGGFNEPSCQKAYDAKRHERHQLSKKSLGL